MIITLRRTCGLLAALAFLALVPAALADVASHQKISDTQGGFTFPLDDDDRFGISIAPLGDLDGDGVDDIVVGAYLDQFYGLRRGAVYTLLLNVDGTVKSHVRITEGEGGFGGDLDFWDEFGISIATIGDLDNDGVVDIAVGARGDDDGPSFVTDGVDVGAIWILFLNTNGTVKGHQKISARSGSFTGGLVDGDWFGNAVAGIGDADGDGVEDLVVAASQDDDGGNNRGAVWTLYLNANGTVKAHKKISSESGGLPDVLDNDDRFGGNVANIGDLDGDGVVDLAVGALFDDDGGVDRGAVHIIFRNQDGTVKAHQKISDTEGGFTGLLSNDDRMGVVSAVGNACNGQQVIAVGAGFDDDGGFDHGAVWVLRLNDDGTVASHWKISSTAGGFTGDLDDEDYFGNGVASLGDFNGDGAADLAVGARLDDDGGENHGAVWLLFLDEPLFAGLCDVQPSSIDVGTVPVNNFVDAAFTIKNAGCGPISGTVSESCPMFSILTNDGPFSLNGGDSLVVSFRFAPTTLGNHSCTIQTGNLECGDVLVTGFAEPTPPEPNILSILDVGNDQGRNVRVSFERSGRDQIDSPTPILQYEIFRRIDPLPTVRAPQRADRPAGMISDAGALLAGWDYVGSHPAHGEAIYNVIAPTLADSTIRDGMHWSVFFVRAATAQPLVFFDSAIDSGYSLDNRAPSPPSGLTVTYNPLQGNVLEWNAPPDPDVYDYRVYRDTSPSFEPSPDNLVKVTTATEWFDDVEQPSQYHYQVAAVDWSGNEGPAIEPTITTGIGDGAPKRSALHQNVPNPFNPSTTISYDIAAPGGHVTLEIFDVRGQLIRTLADKDQGPGVWSENWNGRDNGGRRVASGVYFYRLKVGRETFTRKMAIVQ